MKYFTGIVIALCLALLMTRPAPAAEHAAGQTQSEEKQMGDMNDMSAQQMQDMFLKQKDIDGYTVFFHVMKVTPEMNHGGTHNFMVKIEDQGKALDNVVVNSKVIAPDGKSDSKFLMKMGNWYMNGYDLDEPGKYQLMILFKTADGKKHKGGVFYESPK